MTTPEFRFKSIAALLAIALGLGGLFLYAEFGISFQTIRPFLGPATIVIIGVIIANLYKRDTRLFDRPFVAKRSSPEQLSSNPTYQVNKSEAEKSSTGANENDLAKLESNKPDVRVDMANAEDWNAKVTVLLLCLLMAGEIAIAFKSPEGRSSFFGLILSFVIMSGAPLLTILVAILKSSMKSVAIGCAWISIAAGFLVQYNIFISHADATILFISFFVYWLCGILVLFSLIFK